MAIKHIGSVLQKIKQQISNYCYFFLCFFRILIMLSLYCRGVIIDCLCSIHFLFCNFCLEINTFSNFASCDYNIRFIICETNCKFSIFSKSHIYEKFLISKSVKNGIYFFKYVSDKT